MRIVFQRYIFSMVVFCSAYVTAMEHPSTAFYYAANPPVDLLSAYERVVVEPDNISAENLHYLQSRGAVVYAYLSIGEVDPNRTWFDQVKEEWKQGINTGWDSAVMDMTSKGWHNFLLNKRMHQLWLKGYRGFFLDTMDSYQLFAKTKVERRKQQDGMITLIRAMNHQYKDVHLLFNRGFEILDQVAVLADGLIAESLFAGWNPEKNEYKAINDNDREWLLTKLRQTQEEYSLPVTVLDYLPPEEREQAENIAHKISQAGFTPWISTPGLDYMGVGSRKLIPRKVLFLYDSRESQLEFTPIHRFLAMPLEYLGYIPDYWDVATGLPDDILKGRYAGIATWLTGSNASRDIPLADWVYHQVKDKLPIAFFGQYTLAANQQLTKFLELDLLKKRLVPPLNLDAQSESVGFEAKPVARFVGLPLINSKKSDAWVTIIDSQTNKITPVFISSWGGAALNPYVLQTVPALGDDEEYSRWIIDPFEFLKAALQLKAIPVPDATTENGNRILTLHIDGDGFYNKSQLSGNWYSAEVILDEFLKPHSLPHTVSIIESEIGRAGLNPELSDVLEPIARNIFKLPNIEIASHSYSHPFNWYQAAATAAKNSSVNSAEMSSLMNSQEHKDLLIAGQSYTEVNKTVFKADDGHYHLPIPDYTFNTEREIKGSIDYIDKTLAPAGKKTKVFLWTGDCLPNEEALGWTTKAQVANINGGDTIIRNGINSMTHVSSSGILRGAYYQPYAPIQNENVYTNDWTGPFYGYQRVIETFKLTDQPKRLKPIGIYYHFYSGERQASVRALHRVYDWTLTQETLPMWLSEYIPRLNAFRTAVYEQIEGGWRIHQAKDLHTLRADDQTGQPDLVNSEGVAGYRNISQGQYITLSGNNEVTLRMTEQPNKKPFLISSNARIQYWHDSEGSIDFRLSGHQPVTFSLANLGNRCVLRKKNGKTITGLKQPEISTLFTFKSNDTGALQVDCET